MGQRLRQGDELTSPWRLIEHNVVATDPWADEAKVVIVAIEGADYRTRDGFEFTDGARRVRAIDAETGQSVRRAETFYGEVAWSAAERLAHDIESEIRYAR